MMSGWPQRQTTKASVSAKTKPSPPFPSRNVPSLPRPGGQANKHPCFIHRPENLTLISTDGQGEERTCQEG